VRREGPGGPVEGVLERTRNRVVVLGRRDEDGVRGRDRVTERGHGGGGRLDVVVLVVRRHVPQALPQLELDARGHVFRRGAQQRRVVRVAAEAAGDPEDAHRYAASTSDSSAFRVTLFARAFVPSGMSAFQFRPNSVRSIVVVSSSPYRELPYGSV